MSQKKVLVLGATGAMGRYLVPRLADMGYAVDAVALDDFPVTHPNIRSIAANSKNLKFRSELFRNNYDGIVDFMIYPSVELPIFLPGVVQAAGHYIYLSSYRVYDGIEVPIRETSPRLIDSSPDVLLRNSDDYCICKARGENVLRSFERKNWTIIRPAITYSLLRYQLVTLEAPCTVARAQTGRAVVLPETAKDVQATMSWAGDVARMIAGLLFNDKAFGEAFTVATAEHHTWGEIADYYKDICGLRSIWVDQSDYLQCLVPEYEQFPFSGNRWQLICDRLFDRVMDNSKILAATGMKQEELMKLYDGLKYEIGRCPADFGENVMKSNNFVNVSMDAYLAARGCDAKGGVSCSQ